jgi:hypothetical protein
MVLSGRNVSVQSLCYGLGHWAQFPIQADLDFYYRFKAADRVLPAIHTFGIGGLYPYG